MAVKKDHPYIALLAFLIIAPYCFAGLNRNLILGNLDLDMAHSYVPPIAFVLNSLGKGIIPLWNPYIFCGTPFLIEPQFALLYPFNLLHLFLSISWATNLVIILHQLMAGLFMYYYLKTITRDCFSGLFGAAVFVLSSAFLARIFSGHVSVICTISWIPLLFLLVYKLAQEKKRKWIVLTGIILALQIFAGHIQFVFITVVGLLVYAIYLSFERKTIYPLKALFAAGVLGIGLSAIQIVPLVYLTRDALRGNDLLLKQMFSLPYEHLITLICPGFFGWAQNGTWWGKWYPGEVLFYAGILPLLLAVFAVFKRVKPAFFFAGLLLLSLIFSFGAYLPFYERISQYLAGFNQFRSHARFLVLSVFSLSVLAALGLAALEKQAGVQKRDKALLCAIVFGIISAGILVLANIMISRYPLAWARIFNFFITYDKIAKGTAFQNNALAFLFGINTVLAGLINSIVFFVLAILLLLVYLWGLFGPALRRTLVVILIAVDLWGFGVWNLAVFNANQCFLDSKIEVFLKENLELNRFASSVPVQPNAGMINGLASLGGYSCFVQKRYNEFINFTQGYPMDKPFLIAASFRPSPLLDLLSLKYIIVPKNPTSGWQDNKRVFTGDSLDVYENAAFLPKAFVAHRAKFITGRDNIFKALKEEESNLGDFVILEEPVKDMGSDLMPGSDSGPEIVLYQPNRVIIKASLRQPGYLVLTDTYNSGWKVYVDGKRSKVIPADYILRAVHLPGGKHTVEFVYFPFSIVIGSLITLSFLFLVCMLLLKKI